MLCKNPTNSLFGDFPLEAAKQYVAKLSHQPALGWDGQVTYAGWKEIPSTYLICKNDKLLPEARQRQMAEMAGSEVCECDAAHMVQCSMPDLVSEYVKAAAKGEL